MVIAISARDFSNINIMFFFRRQFVHLDLHIQVHILGSWKHFLCCWIFTRRLPAIACVAGNSSPALADIKSSEKDFIISSKYYGAVLCFLTFNFTAMIGNILPNFFIMVSVELNSKGRRFGNTHGCRQPHRCVVIAVPYQFRRFIV